MKFKLLVNRLLLASSVVMFTTPALAKPMPELQLSHTMTPLLAQSSTNDTTPTNQAVEVTQVQVNQTAQGTEVILVTANSDKLQVSAKKEGNSYIADITNAQLRLSDGGEFKQSQPVKGIAEISVANVDSNSIRLTVAGEASPLTVELFDSDEGLVFGVSVDTSTAQQPTPETPTEPQQKPPVTDTNSGTNSSQILPITQVQVNKTEQGIEVILVVANSDKIQVSAKKESNSFVINIPNTQLSLPKGQEFQKLKPLAGIAEVKVVNVDANSTRLTVTGEASAPKVELFDSDEGLVFEVSGAGK
ncbi:MAG TPA: AMIN domain-containing protein [Nostocaceae cyanobacterium]|nr:AMIN domain-containing protein [Nostocaceae cyanobacterium]